MAGVPRGVSGGLTAELRAARMVWRREMLHCLRDRVGTRVSLLQSLMFLFVLGAGLGGQVAGSGMGSASAYLAFLFPGVLVIAAQPAAISVGASIVWDLEDGFLPRPVDLCRGRHAGHRRNRIVRARAGEPSEPVT